METKCVSRDDFGMYAHGNTGPVLMGANTLLGNDVYNKDRWPSMSDSKWASGVHEFYGTSCDAS
jgi:hypothetical protein